MKYCVENDLTLFEFHDAEFSLVGYDGRDMVISAECVNIHKDVPQNPHDCDMEIASAEITFRNFHSARYEPGRAWETDTEGNSYPVGEQAVFSGEEAMERILAELKRGFSVFHFEREEQGWSIGGCGIEPYCEIKFDFDSVAVCWDAYEKKAWYELHRRYQYDAVLDTPNGEETVKLTVSTHEEPLSVTVGCQYDGGEYWGLDSDYLWVDAFANLQRQLPDGVSLKCCLTCGHGNFCPVGNTPNELFCTKDVTITQKSDLYFYTEDTDEREKRSRQYCDVCEDYQPQSKVLYTYNDFSR